MPKQSNKDQSTDYKSRVEQHEAWIKMLVEKHGAREIPHPGTARVTIFPNPRINQSKPVPEDRTRRLMRRDPPEQDLE